MEKLGRKSKSIAYMMFGIGETGGLVWQENKTRWREIGYNHSGNWKEHTFLKYGS